MNGRPARIENPAGWLSVGADTSGRELAGDIPETGLPELTEATVFDR